MEKQEVVVSDSQMQSHSQPDPVSKKSMKDIYLDFMESLFEASLLVNAICFFGGIVFVSLSFFWPQVTVSNLKLVLQPFGLTMVVFNVTHGFVSNCARLGIKFRSSLLLTPLVTFLTGDVIYLICSILRRTSVCLSLVTWMSFLMFSVFLAMVSIALVLVATSPSPSPSLPNTEEDLPNYQDLEGGLPKYEEVHLQ